uniref:G-protein coupled receptors family 2 profile 2 domain-containing protein n=1 Tax=Arcella intermedia TaxID=1963864 RepID=A0A6B2L900_9EUKA
MAIRSASGSCTSLDCIMGDQFDGNLLVPFERDAVMGVRIFTSFMSLLGTSFQIFTIIYFSKLSYSAVRYIFFLAVCCFLEACTNLMSIGIYNREIQLQGQCVVQGTLVQLTSVSIFLWIFMITLNLYIIVVFNKNSKIFEVLSHIFVWSVAGVAAGVPWYTQAYGIAGLWCWIIWEHQVYRWLLYYLPLFLVILEIIVLYSALYSHILANYKSKKQDLSKETRYFLRKLKPYPIIFLILYTFSIANRIYDWASPDDSFPMYVIESLTVPAFGFISCIVYCLEKENRKLFKKMMFDMGLCVGLTAPLDHQEFQDEEQNKNKNEVNFELPDISKQQAVDQEQLF